MVRKIALRIMLTLVLASTLTLTLNAQPVESPTPETLFFDDFSDGVAVGWTPNLGPWSVIGGEYFVSVVGNGLSTVNGLDLADCVIETELRFSDAVGFEGGIIFRYTDNEHYYALEISNEYDQVHVLVYTPMNPDYGQAPSGGLNYVSYVISANTDYELKVEVHGNTFTGYLNDLEVISVTDNSYTSGKVGLRARAADVFFDNFAVYSAEAPQPSPPFTDEFSSPTLDSRWTVIDPYGGSTFSLTTSPGFLTIATSSPPDRDLYGNVNFYAPRVVKPIGGDFALETKINATFYQSVQSGGIFVWKDASNFLRLERAFRSDYQEILFVGTINGVWSMPSGEISNPGAVIHIADLDPTYLRLVRIGSTFSGYYSSDGVSWIHAADIELPMSDPVDVGLYVVNRVLPDSLHIEASFDYFRVSIPAVPRNLSIKLSGDFDYSAKEDIKVKLGAIVKDANTGEPVPDANVSIRIYFPNSTLWVSDKMVERLTERGFYDWESSRTIYQMKLKDGVYSVYVNASFGNGPVASDFLLFHIDPPLEEVASLTIWIYHATAIIVLVAGTTIGVILLRRHRKLQKAPR